MSTKKDVDKAVIDHKSLSHFLAKTQISDSDGFVLRNKEFPHYIKYMGSKTKILDFVTKGINETYEGGGICDLFSGSCSIAGALGHCVNIYSNDIQKYSETLAHAYLTSWKNENTFLSGQEIVVRANKIVDEHLKELPNNLSYDNVKDLTEFNIVESKNRELIDYSFSFDSCLFTKYYSGTWWSAYQCLWIDAIREIAETQKNEPHYHLILASLMYAMSYCSQGTGHYAQYRDAKTLSSMKDISIYRNREIYKYFIKKYNKVCSNIPLKSHKFNHEITTLDYRERLSSLPKCTVYADPPYCFVHYSRFYHALETLVLYDFPELQIKNGSIVKGRYRNDRHQSPFCIRSQVSDAFNDLFSGVALSNSNLVLSYSNTGMISLNDLIEIAQESMHGYHIEKKGLDHLHMTMGRKEDRDREVKEYIIIARRK